MAPWCSALVLREISEVVDGWQIEKLIAIITCPAIARGWEWV